VAGVKSPHIFGIPGEKEYVEEKQKDSVPESALEEFIDGVF
jgi:cell division protein FtsZ